MKLLILLAFLLTTCGAEDKQEEKEITGDISPTFPLSHAAEEDYSSGSTAFGAERDGGRKHAGCDLITAAGTSVYAVEDGTVIDYYPFYSGTYAIEVRHNSFLVRYGEVSSMADGIYVGKKVIQGQTIGYVGLLESGNSMLHFEMYSGKVSGPLTVRDNWPYQRRSDLVDPTRHLVAWPYPFIGYPIGLPTFTGYEND